jgi:hypothetical protein
MCRSRGVGRLGVLFEVAAAVLLLVVASGPRVGFVLCLAIVSFASPDAAASHIQVPLPGTTEVAKLQPSVPPDTGFGAAVDVEGDVVVVGADGEEGTRGAAYVFRSSSGSWQEEARLTGSGPGEGDGFGVAVSLSGDALAVGAWLDDEIAWNAGAVHVFRRAGGVWVQEAKLVAGDAAEQGFLGRDVAIHGDVVAATSVSGAVYLFRKQATGWIQERRLAVKDRAGQAFGREGVNVAASGGHVAIGAPYFDWGISADGANRGLVFVYRYDGTSWITDALFPSDRSWAAGFGTSVDASGDLLLATAPGVGSAYVFRHTGTGWIEESKLQASYPGGDPRYVPRQNPGAIAGEVAVTLGTEMGFVFRHSPSEWRQEGVLRSSDFHASGCSSAPDAAAADGDVVVLGDSRYCNTVLVYAPRCNDGADEDGDGLVDLDDPGCLAAADFSEGDSFLVCDDGADNDRDYEADADDPGCLDPLDPSEQEPGLACDNGLDDDGDGHADLADPGCSGLADASEHGGECDNGVDDDGDGFLDYPSDPGCTGLADTAERQLHLRVDATADTSDATRGDGVCADASGACTLLAAIDEANAFPGADEVEVPQGLFLVGSGFAIADSLTLRGAGAERTVITGGTADWLDVIYVEWGSVAIRDLTIWGSAGGGGGIHCDYGCAAELDRVIVTRGGAYGVSVNGTMRIRDSAIFGNGPVLPFLFAGGIVLGGGARLELVDSTVSSNASGVVPVFSFSFCFYRCYEFPTPNAIARVASTTIAHNEYVGILAAGITTELHGTMVARNGTCDGGFCGDCTDAEEITSLGHNLDSDGSCGLDASTDLSNVDPLLGPLQDNGGPTPTHALLRGSPAIDAIPTRECVYDDDGDPETPAVRLAVDQRGVTRPRNGDHVASSSCDIGAYETTKGANGIDDDHDGTIDFDGGVTAGLPPEERTAPDPHCASAKCVQEQQACGLGGADLVLLGALAWGVARVRRR